MEIRIEILNDEKVLTETVEPFQEALLTGAERQERLKVKEETIQLKKEHEYQSTFQKQMSDINKHKRRS